MWEASCNTHAESELDPEPVEKKKGGGGEEKKKEGNKMETSLGTRETCAL